MSDFCLHGCYWECEHRLTWLRGVAGIADPMLMRMQKEIETRSVADIASDVRARLLANVTHNNVK